MHRALVLLAALLLTTAQGTPPAPVGGDMSNTTTKATGSSAARKLGDRAADWIDPANFGAYMDGASHPLSGRYSTLAAAQAVCPEATALTQEIDWCAVQAAIDLIAARPVISGVSGTPGGNIRLRAGTTLKLGTTPLVANRISLTLQGDDQWSSAILVGATPMLQFGLSNGMGLGNTVIAATGSGYAAGDVNTLTGAGGTCADPPQFTVATVGPSGEVLTTSITHAGSCAAVPTNPLGYGTSGLGYGATFNGTFTGTALTSVSVNTTTGTGCVNGETLTAIGGSTPGGSPTPFVLTITNAVAGVVQKGGWTVSNPGSYGTPPPNPVSTTGSAGCTGATFNISAFTNSGYALTMERLQLIADAPGASVLTAQFNTTSRSTSIRDLLLRASGANYFAAGFDLTSVTNGVFQRVDTSNNSAFVNSNPSAALFVVRQQNNLLGHFEHYWDHISAYAFVGGAIDYLSTATDTVPFQGLKFIRIGCSIGLHCLRLENTGARAYGNVYIDDLFGTQNVQQIEINQGFGVVIANSSFGIGNTRLASLPSSSDFVSLTGVRQITMNNNVCSTAVATIPTATCIHALAGSAIGFFADNIFTNAGKVPSLTGYVFDSGVASMVQGPDYFAASVTPVVDNGSSNTTLLTPPAQPPCVQHSLVAAETYTVPDGTSCMYFGNGLISSATVTMPANPTANQVIQFTAFGTITTLTMQANTGQTMGGAPTTITSTAPFSFKYISGRWQRV